MAWNWGISIITFAFGLGIGFVLAYLLLPRTGRIRELEQELEAAQAAHQEYRGKVGQHFQKTAELFEDMTERYRAVYRHMAGGAQTLCGEQPPALRLDPADRTRLVGGEVRSAEKAAVSAVAPATLVDAADTSHHRPDDDDEIMGDAPHIPELTEEVSTEIGGPSEKATTASAAG